MRRFAAVSLGSALLSVTLAASTPSELFQKAKTQFRLRSYAPALATLDQLSRDSEHPENASYRTALGPSLAFYRAACLAALGRMEEARSEFEIYLVFQPSAVLDPAIYPKPVIQALADARRNLARRREAPEQSGSVAAAYRAFARPDSGKRESLGEDWATGPVRFLLSADERRDFQRLSDPLSRSEYVMNFWRAHDPRPETLENELREEFEKRVAFADARFAQDEVRGALTDRGMVFLLLGAPTYVGRRPITTGEDTSDPAGMSRFTRNDIVTAQAGMDPRTSGQVVDRMTGPTNKMPDAAVNWREIWHYRREVLPKRVPYQQVDFEFITRKGYGKNVLQREDAPLSALEAARKALLDRSAWMQATG
ncbi:MAG: GWxTD domain-containing protein [Acidobacteriota bacterium]|nr:GWxTD domain-containing protein [Acidobacteriota bacterium]